MKIEIFRVRQYSSKKVSVICVDGKPFCTARGNNTITKIIGRLNGYNTDLTDKALERDIDNYLEIEKENILSNGS